MYSIDSLKSASDRACVFLAVFSSFVVLSLSASVAAPDLQIVSPQAFASYDSTNVTINVTSNETVDFFFRSMKRDHYIERNSTSYVSRFYGQNGTVGFTIFANNSNGVSNRTVEFNFTKHNPVEVGGTSGGVIGSPDTEYVLVGDIGSTLFVDITTENISVNLNGYTINGDGSASIIMLCSKSVIYNGSLVGGVNMDFADGCLLKDLAGTSNDYALRLFNIYDLTVDGMTMTTPVGVSIDQEGFVDLHLKNSRFTSPVPEGEGTVGFIHDDTVADSIIMEETKFVNYSLDFLWINEPLNPEFILRNSKIALEGADQTAEGTARIYTQHKALLNTTDQNGVGIPVAVEIFDNSTIEGDFSSYLNGNPTDKILVATNSSGLAEVWVTEKVDLIRINSPPEVRTVEYDPYVMRAIARDANATVLLNISSNSTFPVPIGMNFPSQNATTLPDCAISSMLDLNGDGSVNAHDMKVIVEFMTNKPVTVVSLKGCNALKMSVN